MALKTGRYALIDWVYRKSTSAILATVVLIYIGLGLLFGLLYFVAQEGISSADITLRSATNPTDPKSSAGVFTKSDPRANPRAGAP
jgi:hypothetical protein